MAELAFDVACTPELEERIGDQHFAEEERITGLFTNLSAYIADAPVAFAVPNLFAAAKQPIPDAVDIYRRFSLWLVPHRFGIKKRGGFAQPVSAGIEIEYRNDSESVALNVGMTCSVVSMLPAPEFQTLGFFTFAAGGEIAGRLGASGELVPSKVTPEAVPVPQSAVLSNGALTVRSSATVGAGLDLRLKVVVPTIGAIGLGSSRAEWSFSEALAPLHDRDIETWSLLAMPRRLRKLSYRARLSIVTRTAFFPTRRETKWTSVECTIA